MSETKVKVSNDLRESGLHVWFRETLYHLTVSGPRPLPNSWRVTGEVELRSTCKLSPPLRFRPLFSHRVPPHSSKDDGETGNRSLYSPRETQTVLCVLTTNHRTEVSVFLLQVQFFLVSDYFRFEIFKITSCRKPKFLF